MTSANDTEDNTITACQSFSIRPATTQEDLLDIANLFRAYGKSLNIDLSFQGFTTELANIPGRYGPPTGALLLARNTNNNAIGCVGLRLLDTNGVCEMKRLYVALEGRGLGLGKALVQQIIEKAKKLGYNLMRLDTLDSMTSAQALYTRMGFVEREAYYDTPIQGTVFFELDMESI